MKRRTSIAARVRWLLAVMIPIGVAWSFVHFRAEIISIHDPGFALISANPEVPDSKIRTRHVVSSEGQFITLDPTGRFLINSVTHKPVFILGESPWLLVTRLSDSDVETYLSDRASRGFNYVWCEAADDYPTAKDYDGHPPFDGQDFTNEDPYYWAHVDEVIRRAAAHGITVALNPGFVGLTAPGFLTSYRDSSDAVLMAYGAFLGSRYKGFSNIIWALGGDVDPRTGAVPRLTILADGIRSKDTVHLMVAEGQPQFSALDTFAGTTWMDLNWLYFHTTNIPSGVAANYSRTPWLPPFLGEGWYENERSTTPLQLREQGYWAVLSGAYLGYGGFGNSPLWYFNTGPAAQPKDPPWQSQLESPGSIGMMYLGRLFRSREHWKLVPDMNHTVIASGYDSRSIISSTWETLRTLVHREPYRLGSMSSVAARTADGQTIIAYVPNGSAATLTIDMDEITDPGSQAKCWWFNPRNGSTVLVASFPTRAKRKFIAPDAEDWVLVIDSQAANLPAPGN